MNIVTIMNYNWKKNQHINMCYTWINQAITWLNKFDTVFIYTENRLPKDLLNLINTSNTCCFKIVYSKPFKQDTPIHFGVSNKDIFSNHNFLYKLYTTCHINFPYLFLDTDAFIVDSIDSLNKIFNSTYDSVFFIDHETNIPKETEYFEPFINSGCFLMNDPEHIIYNWQQIYKFAKNKNFICRFNNSSIIIPGSDQAILKSYFDYIGYDYCNKNFNIAYNTSSSMINRWYKNKDNGKQQTTLKNQPEQICKIVHYWGKKNLNKNNCPFFKEI